jgi:uncharacterized delta-60 repeat protein
MALEERAAMSAGALDPGFSGDGKASVFFDAGGQKADHVTAVALQADGKTVAVGYADGPNGDRDFAITRLNYDGTLDPGFGVNGRVRVAFDFGGTKNDQARAVVIQPDGKIVVAGQVDRAGGDIDMGVIRLNNDGTLDGGAGDSTPGDDFSTDGKAVVFFDLGGTKIDVANSIALLGEKIVLAGYTQTGATNSDMAVAVLETYGDLDLNFSTGGAGVDGGDGRATVAFELGGLMIDQANAVAIQGNKIVLAGTAHTASDGVDMAIARLTLMGALDSTFSPGGAEGSGKALVGFNLGGSNFDSANAMVIQPDGKIVLGGTVARATAGDFDFAVARLSADGVPDATFGFSGTGKALVAFDLGGAKADEAGAVALQSDGKIVIAGTVNVGAAGNTDFGVARLTAAGLLDNTFDGDGKAVVNFDLGQQMKDEASALALDELDRIIVAGTVQRGTTGDTDFGIARLVPDAPTAPAVLTPSVPGFVNKLSRLIEGTAAAGGLVRVYRDVNNNNQIDADDTLVGELELDVAATAYSIAVPLTNDAANDFLVTATKLNSESTPTDVPTITDEGVTVKVVLRADGMSIVRVRGVVSGQLLRQFGPYLGTVTVKRNDFNGDGVLDLYIHSMRSGRRLLQVFDSRDMHVLLYKKLT